MEIFSYFIILLYFVSKVDMKEEKDIFEVNKNLRFCGADYLKHGIKFFPKTANKSSTRHLSTTKFTPIKIYLESTYLESQGEDFPYLKDMIPKYKKALNMVIKAVTSLLKVQEETDNIFSQIGPDFFNYYKVYKWNPIFENGSYLNSNYLLIVKIDNTNQLKDGVNAAAMPIVFDPYNNRPIVGIIIINNKSQNINMGRIIEYYSQVFLHELTHALGFAYQIFSLFPGGLEKTAVQKTIRGVKRNLIITPKVVETAKRYFNCSDIIGVELEDQGGPGTENSHWDQRILLGDYMGGIMYQEDIAISEITLALLEDSQWYEVNYYTGGLMRFGKNKGCNFLNNLCINSNYETEFDNEFFDYKNKFLPSCSAGRESRTYSILWRFNSIVDYNYSYSFKFEDNIYYSGSMYTADYCPIHNQDIYEQTSTYFTGNCQLGAGFYGRNIYYFNYETNKNEIHPNFQLPKELGEKYSNTSFCIMSSLAPIGVNKMYSSVFHPMCYQVHCSSSFLTIQINDDYIVCPRQGGNVELKGYDGKLHCPDYNLICTGTVICNSIFDCIEKRSLVKDDTFDYNYQSLTTQRYQNIPKVETFIVYELSNDGECPIYCSQCSKNKKCKKCMNGYNLVGINKDDNNPIICDNKINVERGYYKSEDDDIYYLCSKECETCKEKNNKCLVCKENYYFLENSTSCYNKDNYPNGYYFNKEKNKFMACHINCKTCSEGPTSDNKMNCDSCKENYFYDEKLKNCYINEKSEIFISIYISLVISLIIAIAVAFVHISYQKRNISDDLLGPAIPAIND